MQQGPPSTSSMSHPFTPQDVLEQFNLILQELKDWPDRDMITALTALAEQHIDLAPYFVNLIITRLTNPSTHSSYKRPLFYLIDSIMKRVGGPFPLMFTKELADIAAMVFNDLHEVDRNKLDFLFNTWHERKLLPLEVLEKMRYFMMRPPQQQHQAAAGRMFPSHHTTTTASAVAAGTPSDSLLPVDNSTFMDLVKSEMMTVYHQLCADLKLSHSLTLDELMLANPALFAQLQATAEQNARQMLSQRIHHQQPQHHQLPQLNLPTNTATGAAGGVLPRKRPLMDTQSHAQHSMMPMTGATMMMNGRQTSSRFAPSTQGSAMTGPVSRFHGGMPNRQGREGMDGLCSF
eukprot:scaffold446_cov183-Ochromonas_danica.AAC.15